MAQLKPDSKVVSTYGHTRNLKELVALIDICDLLVCVDSAPMHLAVALNKPVVALFGPTNEAVLLPGGISKFVALRKETLDQAEANRDIATTQTLDGEKHGVAPAFAKGQASFLYPGAPAVQLPAETVAQFALDLLKQAAHPDGWPATHAD